MANLTPLRNIYLSGGLFTENLLLKIRDKKDQIPEVQWITFGEKWQEEKKHYYEVWDWAKRLFGEIADNLDTWTIAERFEKWIKPLLQKLGHESEPKPSIDLTTLSEEEQDSILNRIQVSHQLKNHAKIGLHICEDENFDERNDTNYQNKSQHDHFQRFILLNGGVRWGFLSNGKHLRLLGEYSNIYAKGYIQFNLDSIFINKDESEFWVFYTLIHHSHFNETYGLNPDNWIDKLKKKWKSISKKLSQEEADINSNIFSEDVLNVYKKNLKELIERANDKGIMAIKASDSETFMQNLKESELNLSEIGRDFYLIELDSVISDINENLSIIQKLQKRSQEEGIEAGKKLRANVKKALEMMGEGLINSSKAFIDDILKGNIEIKDYYQELLRITYRIIFILYAEAKDLLPGVATIYYNDLGLTFLRKKAQQPIRDDQNTDLWYRLLLLFKYLDLGEKSLGINAFSGELFNPERIHLLLNEKYSISLTNSTIIKIIRELTIVDLGIGLQPIDYTQIGEEEIGGIYEALLDFQPRYVKKNTAAYHFILEEIDTERKGTGSYYTPKGLIDILLKTTLKPVIEKKLEGLESKEDKLKALLDLKICDSACGGGSFLLASIDYIGKICAQIESGQEFPEDSVLRDARRIILQHCIYGVDLNPMALELAKISLWLKAAVNDKPLTFLNNHLKEGNSLLGFAKKEPIGNIPTKAFNSVAGNSKTGIPNEDSKFTNDAKKRLKDFSIVKASKETKSSVQKTLFPYNDSENYSKVANRVFKMNENSRTQLHEKIQCYLELLKSNSWKNLNSQANLWTTSFLWNMDDNHIKETPTDTLILRAKQGEFSSDNPTFKEVKRLSSQFKIFNWFLEFPEVFQVKDPGFDCILLNPPWEVLTFKEMEFFAGKSDVVIKTQNQSERQEIIKDLVKTNPSLHKEYIEEYRKMKKLSHYFRKSDNYILSATGAINYFALFIERSRDLINKMGRIGCIVQSTILTGKSLSQLFQNLVNTNSLIYSFDFLNKLQIFPLHTYQQFSLLTISNNLNLNNEILMAFFTWDINKLKKALDNIENGLESSNEVNRDIMEGGTILKFNSDDFSLFNPNTRTSPMFKSKTDFDLLRKVYERVPILVKYDSNGKILINKWKVDFKILFQMSSHSKLFKTLEQLKKIGIKPKINHYEGGIIELSINDEKYFPLYGGSSIWFFDHRFNEIRPKKDKTKKRKADYFRVSENQHKDPYYEHIPMYWIKESDTIGVFPEKWKRNWLLSFRDISSSNLQRSFVICPIPRYPTVHSLPIIFFEDFKKEIICLIANLSSIPFDYIARKKISGNHFSRYIVEQLPVFPPTIYINRIFQEIKKRVLELVFTSYDMNSFVEDFEKSEKFKPFIWDRKRRYLLHTELDAIFALMYRFNKKDLTYILDTFNILRDNELKEYGEFKTKRLILEAYDKFNLDPELGPLFRLEGVHLEKIKGE